MTMISDIAFFCPASSLLLHLLVKLLSSPHALSYTPMVHVMDAVSGVEREAI